MSKVNFVPLSYYLNPNLFDFVELPKGFLDKIGILKSSVTIEETETSENESYHREVSLFRREKGIFTVSSLHFHSLSELLMMCLAF